MTENERKQKSPDLYEQLSAYGASDFYPFHMPGHKRNKASVYGDFPIEQDITEIYGFDNLHHAEGIIKEAQEELARLYEVKQSFFYKKMRCNKLKVKLNLN